MRTSGFCCIDIPVFTRFSVKLTPQVNTIGGGKNNATRPRLNFAPKQKKAALKF